MAQLSNLPLDLLLTILHYLSARDVHKLSLTNRRLRRAYESTVLSTLYIRRPDNFHSLLQTLLTFPYKRTYIKHLVYHTSHQPASSPPPAPDPAIAQNLGFPSTPANTPGAALLLSLYHLPNLQSLDFGDTYQPVQELVEYALTAPLTPALRALRSARIGALVLDGYGTVEHGDPLQGAMAWLCLPALEFLRLELMTDVVVGEEEYTMVPVTRPGGAADKSCALKHLLMKCCDVGDESFSEILRLPEALETFVWEPEPMGEHQRNSLHELGQALSHQMSSLKTIGMFTDPETFVGYEIRRYGEDAGIEDSFGEALKGFTQLKTLSVPLYVLQGLMPWEVEPRLELVNQLPESIVDLAIDLWGFQGERDEEDGSQADTLWNIEFQLADVVKVLPKLKRLLVSSVEGDWELLEEACVEAGVELRLYDRRDSFQWLAERDDVAWTDVQGMRESVFDWLGHYRRTRLHGTMAGISLVL